ncbi:MAG: PIN domain-containing protein, partial [Gammaproteobacteria bacterium]
MSAVLDASACLAYLQGEAGTEVVAEILSRGAYISAVNLAEVLSKLAEWERDPEQAYTEMMNRGLLGGMLHVTPLLPEECTAIARLRPMSKHLGLS